MAGRFEGLSDLEWKLFDDVFPKESPKRGKGMPHAPYRHVLNSLLYILITGCRWCDLPKGDIWASKSSSHRWLKRWRSNATFEHLKARILAMPAAGYAYADEKGLINWDFGAIDGSFSPGKGGGEDIAYGGKGKGVLIHTLTEGNGMPLANCTTPANGNEREQVLPLLDKVKLKTLKPGRPRKRLKVLAADKGYDCKDKRAALRRRGIRPQIPKRVWKTKKNRGRPIKISVPRFQQERCFAWYQRKYRRLSVRWERQKVYFDSFLDLATIHIWIQRILLVG